MLKIIEGKLEKRMINTREFFFFFFSENEIQGNLGLAIRARMSYNDHAHICHLISVSHVGEQEAIYVRPIYGIQSQHGNHSSSVYKSMIAKNKRNYTLTNFQTIFRIYFRQTMLQSS